MLILQGGSTVEVTEVEKQWMSSESCCWCTYKVKTHSFLKLPSINHSSRQSHQHKGPEFTVNTVTMWKMNEPVTLSSVCDATLCILQGKEELQCEPRRDRKQTAIGNVKTWLECVFLQQTHDWAWYDSVYSAVWTMEGQSIYDVQKEVNPNPEEFHVNRRILTKP